MKRSTVLAAGGVLWRGDASEPEVAIVHRPEYDDWSLPKGKAKPDEHRLVTALREVAEETGSTAVLGPFLRTVRYRVSSGGRPATKEVSYWAMQHRDGEFLPSREVDRMQWLDLDSARRRLTTASDRAVLDAFRSVPRDTDPLVLVRHGATAPPMQRARGRRGMGETAQRRLNHSGWDQADALVPVLARLGVTGLLSADVPACAETLSPFAASSGLTVRREPRLTRDGFEADPRGVVELVRDGAGGDGPLAVCGQRRVIRELVHELGHDATIRLPHDGEVDKGGWWLLHQRSGRVVAVERHEPAA